MLYGPASGQDSRKLNKKQRIREEKVGARWAERKRRGRLRAWLEWKRQPAGQSQDKQTAVEASTPRNPYPQRPALLTHEHNSSLSIFRDLLQQLQAFPPVTISPGHVQGLLRTQNWNRAGTQTGGRGRPSHPSLQAWTLPPIPGSGPCFLPAAPPNPARVGAPGDMPHIRRGPAQDLDPSSKPHHHRSFILFKWLPWPCPMIPFKLPVSPCLAWHQAPNLPGPLNETLAVPQPRPEQGN